MRVQEPSDRLATSPEIQKVKAQWIAFLPRAHREAKLQSSPISFGCSKFFISVETGAKVFQCGLQIECGYVKVPRSFRQCQSRPDWDWFHRIPAPLPPYPIIRGRPCQAVTRKMLSCATRTLVNLVLLAKKAALRAPAAASNL